MSGVASNSRLLDEESFKLLYIQTQVPEVQPEQIGSFGFHKLY